MIRLPHLASFALFSAFIGTGAISGCASESTDGNQPIGQPKAGTPGVVGTSGSAATAGSSVGVSGSSVGGSASTAGTGNGMNSSGAGTTGNAGAGNAGTASGGAAGMGSGGANGGGGVGTAGTGTAGQSTGGKAGVGGMSGAGGSAGTGTGGMSGTGGSGNPGGITLLDTFALTWYTFQDNTPVNSSISSSGRELHPFISVAIPFRLLKEFGGAINYGDKLYVEFLKGRVMPNGKMHSGWVQVDDYCGDNSDDSYCFQDVGGKSYPNTDLYIGDFTKSGMALKDGDCTGPAGTGQDITKVYTGKPATFVSDYGGAALGSGKCDDKKTARAQQLGPPNGGESECWGYDDQETGGCSDCEIGVSCTSK